MERKARSQRLQDDCRDGKPPLGWLLAVVCLTAPFASVARGDDADEVARLRRELAEKDRIIQSLSDRLANQAVPSAPAALESVLADPPDTTPPAPAPATGASIPNLSEAGDASLGYSALFDNLSMAGGIDGSKQPQDFGVNALFGGRFHFDWGIPLIKDKGIGFHVGSAINFSDDAVQVFDRIQGTKQRLQSFTTLGLYQRTDWGLNWGGGYDFLYEQYFDHFHLGQWRGYAGYEVTKRDEVGTNFMLRGYGSSGYFGKTAVTLHSINMANLFYRHTFNFGASTTFWAGLADGHNETNAALGDAGLVRHPFVWGAQVDVPLNEHFAIFGQANFITPPATGTVDAFLGIVYHPIGLSTRKRSSNLRPVMATANNPTFAVDLERKK